ncbi:MAG: tyrosine-type recombinase/integrase [Candidatus Aminicenantes bacterium]|nr:tyrosine-type recombinase/integrase [Candidatus Aminicenantes bacterium]
MSNLDLRDRTLLFFLYNTEARIQKVADLCVSNIEFEPQPRVYLHGKGDKWRVCQLWRETASFLKQLLYQRKNEIAPDRPVFMSHNGCALTRYGIYKIVRRHTQNLISLLISSYFSNVLLLLQKCCAFQKDLHTQVCHNQNQSLDV